MVEDLIQNELLQLKTCDNIASLQSFLGLANYNQIFIYNMPNLRAHLNELLKKGKPWVWTAKYQEVFEKLKKKLPSDLFLTHYNPDLDNIVASDASSCSVWVYILLKMTDGATKLIAHASRILFPAEKKKLFANWKRSFGDFICSLIVLLFYSWWTL